jgi:hypothetical protein
LRVPEKVSKGDHFVVVGVQFLEELFKLFLAHLQTQFVHHLPQLCMRKRGDSDEGANSGVQVRVRTRGCDVAVTVSVAKIKQLSHDCYLIATESQRNS